MARVFHSVFVLETQVNEVLPLDIATRIRQRLEGLPFLLKPQLHSLWYANVLLSQAQVVLNGDREALAISTSFQLLCDRDINISVSILYSLQLFGLPGMPDWLRHTGLASCFL